MAALISGGAGKLRVGTWNIREALHEGFEDGSLRSQAISEISASVKKYGLDVLALQEVPMRRDGSSIVIESLARATDLKWSISQVLSPSAFDVRFPSGISLASRVPPETSSYHVFNKHAFGHRDPFDKGCISANYVFDGAKMNVMNLHMFPFHRFEGRAEEPRFAPVWDQLAEIAGRSIDSVDATLIVGDFNSPDRSLLLNRLPANFKSVNRHHVTHGRKIVDDIIASPLVIAERFQAVDGFSDHKLCIMEFVLNS